MFRSKSDGSTLDMSVFTEQKDLEAVIDLMQAQDYVDQKNLFLMGTSQGGAVSAITASEHPDEIRGLILLYPAFLVGDWARKLFKNKDDIPDTYFHMWMDVLKKITDNMDKAADRASVLTVNAEDQVYVFYSHMLPFKRIVEGKETTVFYGYLEGVD